MSGPNAGRPVPEGVGVPTVFALTATPFIALLIPWYYAVAVVALVFCGELYFIRTLAEEGEVRA